MFCSVSLYQTARSNQEAADLSTMDASVVVVDVLIDGVSAASSIAAKDDE